MSSDGRFVVYATADGGGLYLYDHSENTTTPLISVDGAATAPSSISLDGKFVVFTSQSKSLVPGQIDTNNYDDVYLYDVTAKTTVLISHSTAGTTTTGNGPSYLGVISGDGRFVSFDSYASDLAPGDTNVDQFGYGVSDVFLFRNPSLFYAPPANGADDTFTLHISIDGNVEILNSVGQVIASQPLATTPSIIIDGEDGHDDLLTLDFTNGNPLPAGGITFNGGLAGSDGLKIIGSGTQDGIYKPDPASNGSGIITVNGGIVNFTGLEPIDVSGLAKFTVLFPGSDDVVNMTDGFDFFAGGTVPALRISGTSLGSGGPIGFETVAVWNVGTLVINTADSSAGGEDGNDTITINSTENAHAISRVTAITGTGEDSISINDAAMHFALNGETVLENSPHAVVGMLTTLDSDNENEFSYTILPGDEGAQFAITDNHLLVGPVGLNYESGATRSVTVRTTNASGLFFDRTFAIQVVDVLSPGDPDPSFGDAATPGYAIRMDHGSGELLIDPSDGGLLEVNRLEINRYSADGVFQWSVARGQLSAEGSFAGAVLDADGRILVAGTVDGHAYAAPGVPGGTVSNTFVTSTHDIAVWRYNPDGTLDSQFGGGDGVATIDFPSYYAGKRWSGGAWITILANTSDDYAKSITIDHAGRIVVTGLSNTFDMHTLTLWPSGPDGTPYLSPTRNFATAFSVARLNSDGTPDTTFGEDMFRDGVRDGTILTYGVDSEGNDYWSGLSYAGGAIDVDNRIVQAGVSSNQGFSALRYMEDGQLDQTFGVDGFVSKHFDSDPPGGAGYYPGNPIALDSQGRIVILGISLDFSENQYPDQESFVLVRFTANGAVDEDFGIDGMVTIITGARGENELYDLAIDANDRILEVGHTTAGYYDDGSPRWTGLLARQKSDGSIDEGFGDAGFIRSNFSGDEAELDSIALDTDGRIVVTGTAFRLEGDSWHQDAILARYLDPDPDGDGIENSVDTEPMIFSNDFSDVGLGGATTGTITNRGNGNITIVDSPDPTKGVRVATDSAANFSVPNATITVPGPGEFEVTHGSVILKVLAGTIEATFVADSGQVATTSLVAGNGLTFHPASFTFVAPATNAGTVSVLSGGSEINVEAGTTVRPVQIQVKAGDSSVNLASNGILSVTIFSTAGFDASQVNVGSVIFAGAYAVDSYLLDVNGDGRLDLTLNFRTQDTNLRLLYEQLLADDINCDGVLDSSHQTATAELSGETVDHIFIEGFGDLDLFLSGKKLRSLLDELAASGAI